MLHCDYDRIDVSEGIVVIRQVHQINVLLLLLLFMYYLHF